jgi:hypothetical protein
MTEHRVAFRVGVGAATLCGWLGLAALGNPLQWRYSVDTLADVLGLLAWFVPAVILAVIAGWRRDRIAAVLIVLGGMLGAAVVASARGVPEVEPGADPAMRAGYQEMVTLIAAGVAAVLGSLAVVAAYSLGRIAGPRHGPGR